MADYIAQTAEPMTEEETGAWLLAHRRATLDCCVFRVSMRDGMVLFEAWRQWPEDFGEPQWLLQSGDGAIRTLTVGP